MLMLKKEINQLSEKTIDKRGALQDEVNIIDDTIDKIVYKIYDLTDKEIGVVEKFFVQ
jgi:hypothetical protein